MCNKVWMLVFASILLAAGMPQGFGQDAPNPKPAAKALIFRMATDVLPEGGTKLASGTPITPSD